MATVSSARQKTCRFDMRMTSSEREAIELAAAAKGKTLTQWSRDNLLASARRDLEEETTTRLSVQAFSDFAKALDDGVPAAARELLGKKPVWE